MRVFVLMIGLVLSGPVMALATQKPAESDIALIVLPPWQDAVALADAVGGAMIGPVRAPFAILVQSTDPGLTEVAYDAGAWWVTGGAGLAAICGVIL